MILGIKKGEEKGKIEGKVEAAKNMLSKGLDIKLIQEVTGFSLKKIKELKR